MVKVLTLPEIALIAIASFTVSLLMVYGLSRAVEAVKSRWLLKRIEKRYK